MTLNGPFASPRRVARLLDGFSCPWALCGGWAIDCFLGRVTRPHKDVDVAILRSDQLEIQAYLRARGWTLEKAHAGRLTPWKDGELIQLPVHGVWCRRPDHDPDFLELLLNEATATEFCFRRDPSVTLPLERAFLRSSGGLPILAPEIALLYKVAHPELAENRADFESAMPHLSPKSRAWLTAALARVYPEHDWLRDLRCTA